MRDLVLASATGAAYLPAVVTRYGWSDDFAALAGVRGIKPTLSTQWISQARPLFAAIETAAFSLAHTIAGLAVVRAFGILCLVLVALVLRRTLENNGCPPRLAMFLSFSIALLPSFRIWAAWATAMPDFIAVLMSGFASHLATVGDAGTRTKNRVGAVFLFAGAFLIYQPAAMFLWTFLAARLAFRSPKLADAIREFRDHVVVFVLGTLIALAIAGVFIALSGTGISPRAALLAPGEVPDKVSWFLTRYLATAARPFLLNSPSTGTAILTAVPVLAVVAVSIPLSMRGNTRQRIGLTSILFVLLPLCSLPNLLVAENLVEFKWLGALCSTMLIYLAAALWTIRTKVVGKRYPVAVGLPLSILLLILSATIALANTNSVLSTFVIPGEISQTFLSSEVDKVPVSSDLTMHVILPDPPFGPASAWGNTGKLGDYSTPTDLSHPWVPGAQVGLLLLERGFAPGEFEIDLVSDPEAHEPENAYVIDVRRLLPLLAVTGHRVGGP